MRIVSTHVARLDAAVELALQEMVSSVLVSGYRTITQTLQALRLSLIANFPCLQ